MDLCYANYTNSVDPNIMFSRVQTRPTRTRKVLQNSYTSSRLEYVYNLDLKDSTINQIKRGGVIFYAFVKGELFFCLGRDRRTNEITDFGGGRKEKGDRAENILECAVREGNEESRQALGTLTIENIQPYLCLYNPQMLIIFIQVSADPADEIFDLTRTNFQHYTYVPREYPRGKASMSKVSECYNENSGIIWLSQYQMEDLLSENPSDRLFPSVRKFIISCDAMKSKGELFKSIFTGGFSKVTHIDQEEKEVPG
jgi:hypothetical protein